jgi:hypothetical protein
MTRRLSLLFAALLLAGAALPLGCPPDTGQDGEPPLGLLVTPEVPTVTVGGTLQMVATAFYEDGTTADVTAAADWTADGSAISVSSALDSEGVVHGLSEGTAAVQATYMELTSDSIIVRVTDASVVGLSISPTHMELEVGESGFFTAMADFSDGSRGDITGSARWITAAASVVTLASDGRATGEGVGSTSVRAEYEDVASESATVEVTAGTGDDDDDFADDDDDDDFTDDDDDTSQPDLAITHFSYYIDTKAWETYYFVDVSNYGGDTGDYFFVDLFVDAYSEPQMGDDGDDAQIIEGIDGWDTVYADFVVEDVPSYYEWWSYVIVDSWDDVAESDESNNIEGPLDVW